MSAARRLSRAFAVLVVSVLALVLPSCGTTDPSPLFLIDISNQWAVVGETDHSFFFQPTLSGAVSHSSFTGNENTPDFQSFDLEGSFSDHAIQYTVHRASGNVTFSGTIIDATNMRVTGGGQTFTLHTGN